MRRWVPVGLALAAALLLGIRFSFLVTDRMALGVRVARVEVGGLTQQEARERLTDWSRIRMASRLDLVASGRRWSGLVGDMGVVADVDTMLASAYSVGRRGSVFTRLSDGLALTRGVHELPGRYRFDRDRMVRLVQKVRAGVSVPATDASITFDDGVRRITPEVPGTTVDLEDSLRRIEFAVSRQQGIALLPIVPALPKVTAADLEQVDTILASYTTSFPAWRKNRTHNIRLAVAEVNGKLVRPGEIFSYNRAVGPRVKDNGFRDAPIYYRGKIIPGTGGGVCQVSSTVYNAALLANLKIVERSHHSMPVPYVPLGRDATVAYGLLDLRFENTTSAPIYIAARAGRSRLTIEVYGAGRDKKDVRIVTARQKRGSGMTGKSTMGVTVYRVVSENGVELSRERVSSDRYMPAPPHSPKPKAVQIASGSSA